jgi:WD40 repeat protein
VRAVAITPDGRQAVSGAEDRTLRVWDLTTGAELHILTGHAAWVQVVAVTPDGRLVISGAHDKTLRGWDLVTGELRAVFVGDGSFRCFVVAPDARTIVAGDELGRVHFLRLENV